MFCISVNEWHRRAVSFTAHTHTEAYVTLAVTSASAVSLNEDINTWTTSPELLRESLQEHTYVIINIINITVYLMLLLLTVFRIKDMFKSI